MTQCLHLLFFVPFLTSGFSVVVKLITKISIKMLQHDAVGPVAVSWRLMRYVVTLYIVKSYHDDVVWR